MLQFHEPVVRFGTSGTLILLYSIVDHAARRFGADPLRARPRSPRWLAALVFISITAFYLCIKPTGGAIFGGAGNVAGILLCLFAMAARGGNAAGLAPALPSRHTRERSGLLARRSRAGRGG